MTKKNLYSTIIILSAALIVLMQTLISARFSNFIGTDDQSVGIIQSIAPDYQPWANNIIVFNSVKAEPILFGLQASLGLAIIALYILKQRSKTSQN